MRPCDSNICGAVLPSAAMSGGWMPCMRYENENDQCMRHAVQPRLVLVAKALGRALRQLTMRNTDRGAIEAAVQRLADHTAAVVIALKGHPNRVRRIGAWEDLCTLVDCHAPSPSARQLLRFSTACRWLCCIRLRN